MIDTGLKPGKSMDKSNMYQVLKDFPLQLTKAIEFARDKILIDRELNCGIILQLMFLT